MNDMTGKLLRGALVIRREPDARRGVRWWCRCVTCGHEFGMLGQGLRRPAESPACPPCSAPMRLAASRRGGAASNVCGACSERGHYARRCPRVHPPTIAHPADPGLRLVVLTHGLFATIDAADEPLVSRYRWYAHRAGGRTEHYALTRINGVTVPMHRMILGLPRGSSLQVDHMDHDPLNNRRGNLRPCTASQNAANRRKTRGPRTSRFRGVSYDLGHRRWAANIGAPGQRRKISLGYFDIEEDAARAYDAAARRYYGAFAHVNFPGEAA